MKKALFILILCLIIGFTMTLYLNRRSQTVQVDIDPTNSNAPAISALTNSQFKQHDLSQHKPHAPDQVVPEDVKIYMDHKKIDPVWDWKQEIYFYGKVVDESNEPVAGASVDYTWSTINAERGTLNKHQETDSLGLFSIHERGKRIGITVSKKDYYSGREDRNATFEYANPADGLFKPEIANPVIFHLRKKGKTEALIKCEQKVNITLGSTIAFDFQTCRVGGGATSFQCELLKNKSGGTNQTEWIMRLSVPNGGVQFATNEFSFLAPDNDYQPYLDFTLSSPRPDNWQNNGYTGGVAFLKTASGFGKVEVRMIPGGKYFRLISYFNPSGSQNLEYDPNNSTQASQ